MHYGMTIDTKRCIGCHTCAVACKTSNNLPNNVWWNRVETEGGSAMDTPSGQFPNTEMSYVTVACQQCENPACVAVCPTGASVRDEETGIVTVDYDVCIGCSSCINACPYGVRTLNETLDYYLDQPMGFRGVAEHQQGVVEKCVFCKERVAEGLQPACVVACLNDARVFGDLDDPESEVSKLIASRDYKQLLADEGTNPSVYFLV